MFALGLHRSVILVVHGFPFQHDANLKHSQTWMEVVDKLHFLLLCFCQGHGSTNHGARW